MIVFVFALVFVLVVVLVDVFLLVFVLVSVPVFILVFVSVFALVLLFLYVLWPCPVSAFLGSGRKGDDVLLNTGRICVYVFPSICSSVNLFLRLSVCPP